MKREIALVYEPENDRVIAHVPHAMSDMQLKAIARAAHRIDHLRWSQATGTRKEILGKTLKALEAGRIIACVSGAGVDLFKATAGTGKIISLGANAP